MSGAGGKPLAERVLESTRRIGAVVLAAGGSTRLGAPKQLLRHDGETLVRRAALAARDAGADPVVVVLGAAADQIAPSLDGERAISTVVNESWESGLASSLAAGIEAIERLAPDIDGALLTVCDQPMIDAARLSALLVVFGAQRIVAAEYAGTIGVPAVVGREYFEAMRGLTGDAGAGQWLRARVSDVARVAMPDGAVDIDTNEDAGALKREA